MLERESVVFKEFDGTLCLVHHSPFCKATALEEIVDVLALHDDTMLALDEQLKDTIKAIEHSFAEVHSSWKINGVFKNLLRKADMLQYLSYGANRPKAEQKIGFATQGKPKSSTSKKSKSPKKNTTSQDITLDCGCVMEPGRPIHRFAGAYIRRRSRVT
ncbi:hypothetical protein E4U15_001374 [Claviceps sp. LM218 group G6]|nr:hypothetical protein E4U15_001374 [Claviceps sp. LM218 group G6]